ncbi:hypothetical protein FXO38_23724 [Capsicum annuum]|nr:hypothetical protein FXO38_23724 [Capsicum annuum]
MGEIDYRMEEMRKTTKRTLDLDENMSFFEWIMECIASNRKNAIWWLCPIMGDNVLSPVWAAMIAYFIAGYEFDIGVLELPGIDKVLEATKTTNLGLIRDAANPLAQKARQAADLMTRISRRVVILIPVRQSRQMITQALWTEVMTRMVAKERKTRSKGPRADVDEPAR